MSVPYPDLQNRALPSAGPGAGAGKRCACAPKRDSAA